MGLCSSTELPPLPANTQTYTHQQQVQKAIPFQPIQYTFPINKPVQNQYQSSVVQAQSPNNNVHQQYQQTSVAPPAYTPLDPSISLPLKYKMIPFQFNEKQERETMLLLDVTGSMDCATSQTNPVPRKDTVKNAMGTVVATLGAEDSQAVHEQDGEGGGVRTVTFAGNRAHDIGDLNSTNLNEKWERIVWSGSTWIMPGWRKLLNVYHEEFGSREEETKPILLVLIITDGEAEDTDEFANALAKTKGDVYCAVAVIGFGNTHDEALFKYNEIAKKNRHIRVLSFDGESNTQFIAKALLQMVG